MNRIHTNNDGCHVKVDKATKMAENIHVGSDSVVTQQKQELEENVTQQVMPLSPLIEVQNKTNKRKGNEKKAHKKATTLVERLVFN